MAFVNGYDHEKMDTPRGVLLLLASHGAGCQLDVINCKMKEENLSDEAKKKILKDLKQIATTSPYHWIDYYIGEWFKKGWGGEKSNEHAVVWFTKAINGANAHAMNTLGYAYENGNLGLTQSDTKANELYALAAEKGHAVARCNLGYNYYNGIGVEIDFSRGFELYEQSAKQGDASAQFNLSSIYRNGSEDNENGNPMTIPVNYPLHFTWALAAAKQDHIGGQAYSGML